MSSTMPATSRWDRLNQIAAEVAEFAREEALASGLPGMSQGPADAYRHLIGVAELSRRLGPLTAAAGAERNEWRSIEGMLRSLLRGEAVSPANTAAARWMDRHNNWLAVVGGSMSRSAEDSVLWARRKMEQAILHHGGSGLGGTVRWLPRSTWSDGGSLAGWSPDRWPNLREAAHFKAYEAGIAVSGRPDRESTATGGTVHVRPHVRDGHPVSGHTRSPPDWAARPAPFA